MGVRVKVKLDFGRTQTETVALANSGYEGEEPELVLPLALAKKLKLFKKSLKKIAYKTAGGTVRFFELPGVVAVEVRTNDRTSATTQCKAVISPYEDEVVLNDIALSRLGIVILSAGERRWRFADEQAERESELKSRW